MVYMYTLVRVNNGIPVCDRVEDQYATEYDNIAVAAAVELSSQEMRLWIYSGGLSW